MSELSRKDLLGRTKRTLVDVVMGQAAVIRLLEREKAVVEEKLAWVHAYLEEEIGNSYTPMLDAHEVYRDLHGFLRCCGFEEKEEA